jgi:hypothetical protein
VWISCIKTTSTNGKRETYPVVLGSEKFKKVKLFLRLSLWETVATAFLVLPLTALAH